MNRIKELLATLLSILALVIIYNVFGFVGLLVTILGSVVIGVISYKNQSK